MNQQALNILVTGASGLVGQSIVTELLKKNYRVTGISNRSGIKLTHPHFTSLQADLTRVKKLSDITGDQYFSHIVHCAALIPSSQEEVAMLNSAMDTLMIAYLREVKTCSIVYLSTTGLYKQTDSSITENGQVEITDPYYLAKHITEHEITALEFPSTVLRISSPYGPHQRNNNVLKHFITQTIRGNDIWYYGDGTRSQDFIHSHDIATAVVKCLEHKPKSDIYNIVSSHPVSMKSLALLVKSVYPGTATQVLSKPVPAETNEAHYARYDNSLAKKDLGWSPVYTLEQGINEWIKTLVA